MDEIRHLRHKFILVGTLAVVIIVAVALGLINTITYVRMKTEVDTLLTMISQNNGMLPHRRIADNDSWTQDPDWYNDTPESIYQTRYFSIVFDKNGTVEETNFSRIASFSENEAVQVVKTVLESRQAKGLFKKNRASYAYMITPLANGNYRIVVMDCTKDTAAVESFMRYSVRFGIGCIVVYVLILTALCNLIIRPFVENMQNQKRFITNAGHELKTPIAIISANTEALEMIQGKSEWTTNILAQVKRVTRLINELITMAKLDERKNKELHLMDTDVSALLTNTVDSFTPMLSGDDKKLEKNIPDGLHAMSDANSLTELVSILMDNAVKYCDNGGRIVVDLVQQGTGGFKISVSNSYAKGANEDYSHNFERFYRGDTSHNSTIAGYGIGLSMAKELVQLLKGNIGVSYKDGMITYSLDFAG